MQKALHKINPASLLVVFLLLFSSITVFCQVNISKAEYFIDVDPGFGLANNIPITAAANIADKNVNVSLTAVPDGFHNLFVRSMDANGMWSISNKLSFFKVNSASASLPNITKAEYFIDTDPGYGLANNIPVTAGTDIADRSFTIPLSSIADGFHNLFVRSMDANGMWSISNKLSFYKVNAASASLPNITKAEYFIDTDPGFGLANNISVNAATNIADQSATIPLTAVPDGFHNLFVRSMDANGIWSISNKLSFYKVNTASASLPNITKVEYFIDVDPGFGLANNIPVTAATNIADQSATIPLTTVPDGFHNLFVRSMDANGVWSISNKSSFYKVNTASALLPNITQVEYFIDTDPGFGLANNIPVNAATNIADQSATIPLTTVPDGFHNLFVRSRDANGVWSISNKLSFFKVNTASASLPNITKAEYFIDTDPGFGLAKNIPLTAAANIANLTFNADLSGVAAGFHRFYIRSQDVNGKWSITNTDTFTIAAFVIPTATIGNLQTSICAGTNYPVPFTVNAKFSTGNTFTAQLSDANGGFASPVVIGSLATDTSGTINCIIPSGTAVGTAYRIRIISTSPIFTSRESGDQLTIKQKPSTIFTLSGASETCQSIQPYTISITETNTVYSWQLTGIGTLTPNGNSATVNWTAQGVNTLSVTATNSCGSSAPVELVVNVFATAPQLTPLVALSGRVLTATLAPAAQSITGYQWYKDGNIIAGQTNQSYTVPDNETGSFTAVYTNACGTGLPSSPTVVAVAKTNQTITFTPVATKTFGDAAFEVTATASSALPISSYTILSGPATINGNTVTIIGAGTIEIKAVQDGDATFNAGESILSITVNKAAATVSLSNLTHVYDGAQKQAIATTTPLGLNVMLTYNGSTNLPTAGATYNVVATITSANYQGTGSGSLVIAKANQTIQISNPGSKNFNDVPFGINASATSGEPVSFTLQTIPVAGVASVNGSIITMLGGGGTVTIIASQAGNQNYNAAPSVSTTFNVTPPSAKDLQVIAKLAPGNGCTTGLTAPIIITIRNTGTAPATNFPVSFRIGNEPVVTETFTGTIGPNSNANYTFTTNAVFAQTGVVYPLTLNSNLAGDEKLNNDTLLASVIRYAPSVVTISRDTAICFGGTATLQTFGAAITQWTGGPNSATYIVSPATTTTYTATVTDINNCTTQTLTTTVTVNPAPAVNAGVDQSIFRGSSASLLATGAASYLWNNGVNTAANVVTPQSTTAYTVTGTNALGCKATDEVLVTVNFSAINVSPGLLQFGGVVVDSNKTAIITITNNGTVSETITSLAGIAAPFTINQNLPVTVPAGTTLQLPVLFSPTATLFYQSNMTVATTAGDFVIVIRGTGVDAAPAWTVSPASYNFGKVSRNTFVTKELVIKNTGNVSIRISSVSSNSVRYVGTTNGLLNIPIGGSVNLSVRFNPIAITSYNGNITVRSSTPNLPILKAIVDGQGFIPGPIPQLQFLTRTPLEGTSGVSPKVGGPGNYTYSVLYKHSGALAPIAGFPKVGIDKNNDGDFADAGEGSFTMTKEGTGTNWAAGEIYNYTTSLGVSELYGYQFFATDVNNNDAVATDLLNGPVVTREVLDLHIFASDITFSMVNPAVNQNFTVTAKINNNSPYAASDVPIRFYYKDSLFLFNDTIPFIDGHSTQSITRTLNFSPDGFYPIKVWIDSARTLSEGNILNNYASRPVIVGNFTVPGTIDLVSNASPSGCSRGKILFTGSAKYRGLNLAGTPPVEGSEVTIIILDRPGAAGPTTIKTTTDINGNWYYYDDPCADNPGDFSCEGYICGVAYHYTVEVTDFTLTSPTVAGTVSRPCVQCVRIGKLQQFVGVSGCILPGAAYSISAGVANFEIDFATGLKLCAPTVYKDTINIFVDGQSLKEYTEDSINTCDSKSYQLSTNGLPEGTHQISMVHTYFFANGERVEQSVSGGFTVLPLLSDIEMKGFSKTGHTSFSFSEYNPTCGVTAGPHTLYVYDSLPGYTEKVLIDSFKATSLAPQSYLGFSYSNPLLAPGCHFITILTDVKNEVAELNEGNNKLEAQFCVDKPDIVFSPKQGKNGNIITSIGSGNAGSQINFSVRVANVGAPQFSPFKVLFKANGANLGNAITIPALGSGEEVTIVSSPFTVPFSLCPVEITVKADSDNQVDEAIETNNFDTTKYGTNITAGRSCIDDENVGSGFIDENDVLGTITCQPYFATQNVLTYFATTVRNTGSRDARNIKVQFKLDGVVLGSDVIPLLRAGAKTESGFYYAFDSVRRCIVNAFADFTREICELNEQDNIGNIHIDVKRSVPDLEILSQYIAPSNLNPNLGQSFTIVSTVVNKGDGAATPTKLRFWVNDIQLGEDKQLDSIYPGQDTTVMATVTYSSDIVGPKIIKVTADINREVPERSETNNEATRAIIVGAAPDFARAKSEAITLSPARFGMGDTITIKHYIRNYGGDEGAAWVRFYYRVGSEEKVLIDSLRLGLGSNDSTRLGLRWKVIAPFGQIITIIGNSLPPEFNDQNNIDSLPFGIALPLTLIDFTATVKNNEAELNWLTSDEVNVKKYELERSINANRFEKVAVVVAANSSGQHSYRYIDADFSTLQTSNVYYRLKMVDVDGQFRYSKIVKLSKKLAAEYVRVFPNPVKQNLMVQVQATVQGAYNLRVFDVAGKQCITKQYNVAVGLQTLSIPVYMLTRGSYLLVMQQADGSSTEVKFIKD